MQASAIALAIASFTSSAAQRAQPTELASSPPRVTQERFVQLKPSKAPTVRAPTVRVRFVPPKLPDRGAPGGRQGAGSRGNCSAVEPKLTALVPAVEQTLGKGPDKTTHVWGLTVAEHPTFWFYVPYSRTSASSGQFILQDAAGSGGYKTSITLPEKPGVVSFRLPSTVAPLEIGKLYHWFFKIYCSPKERSISVEGWVQRAVLSPTFESQLAAATPQQRSALYAANGIWYDALTSLAELRLVDPKNAALTTNWTELLQSVGLNEIASAPMMQCCTPKNSYSPGSSQEQRYFQGTTEP